MIYATLLKKMLSTLLMYNIPNIQFIENNYLTMFHNTEDDFQLIILFLIMLYTETTNFLILAYKLQSSILN